MGSASDRALAINNIQRASNLSTAAYEIQLMQAKSPPGMSLDQADNRRLILTAALQIIEDERDATLDDFAARWLRYRGITDG